MKITNLAKLPDRELDRLTAELVKQRTLGRVLTWAGGQPKADFLPHIVAEVITQDEFTHDVVVPYKKVFLVYDTT